MILQLPKNNVAVWKIGGQLINSSTSVHSNIVQARAAISRKDFINHMKIARKEAKEFQKWIETFISADLVKKEEVLDLLQECTEIVKILFAAVKTLEINKK